MAWCEPSSSGTTPSAGPVSSGVKPRSSPPLLFTGSPAAGTYKCVIFKMSDVIGMVPATSFGACVAGTCYQGDIYRDGQTDWKDAELDPIISLG